MKSGLEYLVGDSKRSLDIIGGTVVATALLPAAATVGLLTAIDTRSLSPFFIQERQGRDGSRLPALKFRTIAKSAMTDVVYGTFDPRATRLGQVLRQSGVDEIPQIYNVLQGSMSLVGPRPMLVKDIDHMEFSAPDLFDEWYSYYRASKPGLAGDSQVYRHHFRDGHNPAVYRKSVELDLRYFDRASLAVDLRILAATPIDMLRANRAIEAAEAAVAETSAA